jgi:dTDP-4-amino-4,6-dideoxygalactose transaminase
MRNWAPEDEFTELEDTGFGLKSRLHPLGAALALSQLRKLDHLIDLRRQAYAYFSKHMNAIPGLKALSTSPDVDRGGFFRFVMHYDPSAFAGLTSREFYKAAVAEGIETLMPGWLAKPLHLTHAFSDLTRWSLHRGGPWPFPHAIPIKKYRPGDFPKAEQFAQCTFQFPAFSETNYPQLIDQYAAAIFRLQSHAAAVREFFRATKVEQCQ